MFPYWKELADFSLSGVEEKILFTIRRVSGHSIKLRAEAFKVIQSGHKAAR